MQLLKVSSGIPGLDEITGGGLPAGRSTLVVGGPGSGKTLLGTSFLMRGALHDAEPGVLVSFDERPADLEVNVASLGYDLADLQTRKLLVIEHVQIERQQLIEAGDYNLEGLFVRLGHSVDTIGARRVFLDSLDTLFASIPNEAILRAELRRLFAWLKDRGLTAVITGERGGPDQLSRHGIEEYVSDCVILLDTRIHDELTTRRLRIVKYRGTAHGGNEYPFLIEPTGITVLPVTSIGLTNHPVSDERVSSGVADLDAMLGDPSGGAHGFFKGSSVLLSGGSGVGKTSIAAQFAAAACARGERCLYFAFEESAPQLLRNMGSINLDLSKYTTDKLLTIHVARPTLQGLEMHLASMMHQIKMANPAVVVIDPLSALLTSGSVVQSQMMVLRLIDFIKSFGATALYLVIQDGVVGTDLNVSSLMDTWIALDNVRRADAFERRMHVVKSRGMPHSPDVRQFLIGTEGIEIRPGGKTP